MKKIKPIGSDIYFKYVCSDDCSNVMWATAQESKTKNFKLVCDVCGKSHILKQIKSVTVNFVEEQQKKPLTHNAKKNEPLENSLGYPVKTNIVETKPEKKEEYKPKDYSFLNDAVDTMVRFGYNKKESNDMVRKHHDKTGDDDALNIVKTLMCLGEFDLGG